MITLTYDEAECLANHLEYYIIQEIRDDEEYDSILYLGHLLDVYRKCREAVKPTENDNTYWHPLGCVPGTATVSAKPNPNVTVTSYNNSEDWERLKQELGVDNFCEVKP